MIATGDETVNDWNLTYDSFVPGEEGLREALTSTGNGYFCTRGAAEWEDADDVHYPGTYAHGGWNRETTIMGGSPVLNEDLVNLPNWLVLKLRIEGEEAITLENVELLAYRHDLDIATPMLTRELRFRDRAGRETTLRSRRFVSMAHVHQGAIEWTITAENWSGQVQVVSALDGRVTNRGVARYRALEGRHLDPVSPRTFGPEVIALKVETRQSDLYVAEAARTTRLPRRPAGRGRPQPVPDRGLHPAPPGLRRGSGRAGAAREDRRLLQLQGPRDQRAAGQCGQVGAPVPGLRRGPGPPHGGVEGAVARVRHDAAQERPRPARCCGSTSRTSSRSARATRSTTTRACPPGA